MSPTTAFFAALLCAYAAWQLWTAWSRGEVLARYGGIVRRAEQPVGFWLTVALCGVLLTLFAAVLSFAAWRAVFPAPFAQRASGLYPTRAATRNAGGLVILRCTVTPAYGVKDCSVASETPQGLGFGPSALQISALDMIPQKDRAQAKPGSTINLPIRFKMPPTDETTSPH